MKLDTLPKQPITEAEWLRVRELAFIKSVEATNARLRHRDLNSREPAPIRPMVR